MAGTVSAGTIVYEVDMDTAGILQGRRDIDAALNGLNGSMGRLEAGLNRTERSLSSIEGTMSSLTGVAKALIAALSVQQVGAYAQAWQDLSNKLANAVRDSVPPFETLADVTERVFDISQKTRSGLDATATLYARLERSTRSYGVSVEDITRLTTIINQGFVVSGATAEEASNAIIQLAQGLASGALRGDEFNSVNEQGNRLMIALADSLNVSIGALRNMAAEGKLTTDVIVNGLLSQGDKIGQEFAKTTATISQSLEIANNNITKFFGENATVKTGVKIFSDSVISLSENLDVLSTTLTIVAGVMGARYVGALTMATSAKIADIAASRQQVVADNQTAQAALVAANSVQRKALADKEAALSSLALAQAEYNVAKGSAAEMLAMDALIAAKTRATTASIALAEAENAQAAASARAATTARAASVGIGMARGALALIGGPAGAAMLAAGAIFYFWQKAQQAREEAIRFADSLDKVKASMKEMNNTKLRGVIADANISIRAQEEAISDLKDTISGLQSDYEKYTTLARQYGVTEDQNNGFVIKAKDAANQLAQKRRDLADAQEKLAKTQDMAAEANRTLTNNMLTSMGVHDGLIEKGSTLERVQGAVAKAFGLTADEITRANQAGQNFNPKALQVSPPTADGDKVILNLEEQNELLKIQDERQRAVTKARMQAAKVTDNPNQISRAGDLAGENYDLQKAEEARQEAQRKGEQQDKRSASAAESVAQKLENLRQKAMLAGNSTQELSREQSILNAQQSLGKAATQAQIDLAGEYAAQAYDTASALKEQQKAEKQRQDTEKAYQNVRNQSSPVLSADNQFQQQMASLDAYAQLYPQKIAEVEQTRAAIEEQYRQQRMAAMWQEWQQQSEINQLAASAIDSLQGGATNAITGLVNGTQNLQEAFANIGTTILGSVVGGLVEMGIQWVKSQIMGQAAAAASLASTMAQATAAASAWAPAAISASIATYGSAAAVGQTAYAGSLLAAKGMAVAGAREHGGPVSANSMYRVGEGGKPEIYQANNGSQYMIPGDNGRVISNRDMQGGGSGSASIQQEVHFHIQTTGGIDDATMAKISQMMKQVTLFHISDQANRPGGLIQPRKK
ncbi:tape measure protein [Cronobacter sakazakii]|uniref:tape measure protein n=1 Tax=Cronobacter sakazakii TaxID=28141 RepID=UPI002D7BB32F|nr:tape measure protein [Cronobacter sakazakii]